MKIVCISILSFFGIIVSSANLPKDNFTYLDNGTICIGVDQSCGSAIGYLA